jgi:hypothetical protein
MRRVNDEGAVAVLLVIVVVVLIGMAAMVVDVGALWSERRQLQNGADAGSLAVAQLCAGGDCSGYATEAQNYANENSNDGASNVQEVCGSVSAGLPACGDPPSTTPSGQGWAMVETQTGTSAGPGLLPPFLAQALVPGYNGQTVHAASIANWGAPSGITGGLALTFSECEWLDATEQGTQYASYTDLAAGVWPTDSSGASLERTIYLHDTSNALPCPAGPAGSDLPGGFGWLDDTGSTCYATTDSNGQLDVNTGIDTSNPCKTALDESLNTVIYVPVFDSTNGLNGTNGAYSIAGYAAFYLTGYYLGGGAKQVSAVTQTYPCDGSYRCISGFFTQGLVPQGGSVGDGPSMGATVVGLAP